MASVVEAPLPLLALSIIEATLREHTCSNSRNGCTAVDWIPSLKSTTARLHSKGVTSSLTVTLPLACEVVSSAAAAW